MRASRIRELTGDAADEASWDASGVKERDHKTIPPYSSIKKGLLARIRWVKHLCGKLSSGLAWCYDQGCKCFRFDQVQNLKHLSTVNG